MSGSSPASARPALLYAGPSEGVRTLDEHIQRRHEFSRRMSFAFFPDEQRPPSQRSKAPDGLRDLLQSHEGTVRSLHLLLIDYCRMQFGLL